MAGYECPVMVLTILDSSPGVRCGKCEIEFSFGGSNRLGRWEISCVYFEAVGTIVNMLLSLTVSELSLEIRRDE